jgi:hypothetical protein
MSFSLLAYQFVYFYSAYFFCFYHGFRVVTFYIVEVSRYECVYVSPLGCITFGHTWGLTVTCFSGSMVRSNFRLYHICSFVMYLPQYVVVS